MVNELNARGYSTGIFKSTHHIIDFHPPGRDTSIFRQDGVECVAVKGPAELAVFQDIGVESLERTVFRLFPHIDVVILEGFKHQAAIPKIEVAVNVEPGLYREVEGVRAIITRSRIRGRKVLDPDSILEVVNFLEDALIREYMKEDEVAVFINDRKLSLKYFIKNAVKGLLLALLKFLKFREGARKIDIRITLR